MPCHRYLNHAAKKFVEARYDANCYITQSHCMDAMSLDLDAPGLHESSDAQFLLLSYTHDRLCPALELGRYGQPDAPNRVATIVQPTFRPVTRRARYLRRRISHSSNPLVFSANPPPSYAWKSSLLALFLTTALRQHSDDEV